MMFVDTSAFYAVPDRVDRGHPDACRVCSELLSADVPRPLVTSNDVPVESVLTTALLRKSYRGLDRGTKLVKRYRLRQCFEHAGFKASRRTLRAHGRARTDDRDVRQHLLGMQTIQLRRRSQSIHDRHINVHHHDQWRAFQATCYRLRAITYRRYLVAKPAHDMAVDRVGDGAVIDDKNQWIAHVHTGD
jgi:hypothetical protein